MATTAGSSYNLTGATNNEIHMGAGNNGIMGGATSGSFACWVNYNTSLPTNAGHFGDDNGASFVNLSYLHYVEANLFKLILVQDNAPTYFQIKTSSNISSLVSVGQWNHLCWTWAGGQIIGNVKFYVNGVSQAIAVDGSGGVLTALQASTTYQQIGAIASGGTSYQLNGKIAHVAIYKNKVLTAGQVGAIMLNPLAVVSGLVSYIPLNDAAITDRVTAVVASSTAAATLSTSGPPVSHNGAPL